MSLTKVSFSMIDGEVANVLDFGADPTGVASSTTAIQAAIDTGVGTIFYPDGTYLVNGVVIKSNQRHLGSGAATITTTGSAFTPQGNSSNVIIDSLIFAGTGNAIYQADNSFYSISYQVRNCKFAKSLAECLYWTPINCTIENNFFGFNLGSSGAAHRHLFMRGKPTGSTAANANVIRKNYFTSAIGVESTHLFYGTGNTFSENIWENNSTLPVRINGGGVFQFDGNYFESNVNAHQLYIQANATAIPSPSNAIYINYVMSFTNNVVNMLSAGNTHLFYLDADSYNLSMVGNLIYTNQAAPIYVTDTPAGNNAGVIEFRRNENYSTSFNTTGLGAWNFGDTGQFNSGTKTDSPYNSTTASAANMVVLSNGIVQRSTSSLKYKTDVQNAVHGLAELMTLRPVTYKGNNDGEKVFGGLIAEEVHDAGLSEFVVYDADGNPDALAYANMVALLIKAIQELKLQLDSK
jgi:hypothetical protein